MTDPFVSVIMPVYNCELFVKDAIQSILDQSYTNFELLILDDNSTDSTKTIIKKFKDSRIKLIEKAENTGYTRSLNHGLSLAKGTYIARMDGDDISLSQRFAKQVAFLELHSDVMVCGTYYKIIGTNKVKILPETHEDIKIELLKNTCFGHPTVMIRKEILERHNIKYDIEKEPAEDYDLWVRLLKYGRLYNLNEALLHYRVYDGQVSQKRRDIQLRSKLSTRIQLLEYLGVNLSKAEFKVLEKTLSDHTLNFSELLDFLSIKINLITSNIAIGFFKHDAFEAYLNDLERGAVHRYFLKRQRFSPKIYGQYLQIKKQLHFRLPLKTDIIILIKSILFFRTKKYG